MDLFSTFDNLPWQIGAGIIASFFALITLFLLAIVRNFIPLTILKEHHDVAGFVFANLGVLYAVLLGFTVVNVQERFDKLKGIVQTEASYLADLYRDASAFSEKDRVKVQHAVKNYVLSVVHDEWHSMSNGIPNPKTMSAVREIWKAFHEVEPANEKQSMWYQESIRKLNDLQNIRLARLLGSEESLGSEMWTLLFFGGIILTTFICFFGVHNFWAQMLMAVIISATTAFFLFLIYTLDSAFTGDIKIPPEAFHRILYSINHP